MAIDIRDNERQGRAELEMIDEGSEPEAVIEVSFCFTFEQFYLGNCITSGDIWDCDKDFIWLIWLQGRM